MEDDILGVDRNGNQQCFKSSFPLRSGRPRSAAEDAVYPTGMSNASADDARENIRAYLQHVTQRFYVFSEPFLVKAILHPGCAEAHDLATSRAEDAVELHIVSGTLAAVLGVGEAPVDLIERLLSGLLTAEARGRKDAEDTIAALRGDLAEERKYRDSAETILGAVQKEITLWEEYAESLDDSNASMRRLQALIRSPRTKEPGGQLAAVREVVPTQDEIFRINHAALLEAAEAESKLEAVREAVGTLHALLKLPEATIGVESTAQVALLRSRLSDSKAALEELQVDHVRMGQRLDDSTSELRRTERAMATMLIGMTGRRPQWVEDLRPAAVAELFTLHSHRSAGICDRCGRCAPLKPDDSGTDDVCSWGCEQNVAGEQ